MKLEKNRIRDAATSYEMASSAKKRAELSESTGVDTATLEELVHLAGLMRVQWVGPTFGRLLLAAGYGSVKKIAMANADDLYEALTRVNDGARYFKSRIGLRDTKRLIQAASYV